jgi:hypothetical protein
MTGLLSIIISLVLFMTSLDQSPAKWLSIVVLIGGIVMAHSFFKRSNGGFMSYGQGLSIGSIISVIVGVLSGIFSYIYMTFVDTDFMARTMEKARADMEAKGNMTDEQIDQAMAMSQKFTSGPLMIVFAILGTLIMGFILSLIISAITKNTRPEFE